MRKLELLIPAGSLDVLKTAVLLNGKIVPRDRMESTALKESDTMEIVSFVGGG